MEVDLINRERDIQRQWEDSRIRQARYNIKYKEIKLDGRGPSYLRNDKEKTLDRGEDIRALLKLRCGNLERANKYWLGEEE